MASKPYIATGKYISRMSDYCRECRYRPSEATGEDACPFTTLYWDFLQEHRYALLEIPRMVLQVRNLDRLSGPDRQAIGERAAVLRSRLTG